MFGIKIKLWVSFGKNPNNILVMGFTRVSEKKNELYLYLKINLKLQNCHIIYTYSPRTFNITDVRYLIDSFEIWMRLNLLETF